MPRCILFLFLVTTLRAAEPVSVDILEGTFAEKSWDIANGTVTDHYTEPAFAFLRTPEKWTPKGLIAERSSPFVVRATAMVTLAEGDHTFLVRARGAARLFIDDKQIIETKFLIKSADGHGKVMPMPAEEKTVKYPEYGQQDQRATVKLSAGEHAVRFEFFVGAKNLRSETGEPSVAIGKAGQFTLLASSIPFTDAGWAAYERQADARLAALDRERRHAAQADELAYWKQRHTAARASFPSVPNNSIDGFLAAAQKTPPVGVIDDLAFLRRATLDVWGLIPGPADIATFTADTSPERRKHLVDHLLADDRAADPWVAYWQEVLAENPGLLKPTLNNTGPFRGWLHRAMLDRMPLDRFATELIGMEGSVYSGDPAGFAIASENDVPMAAKAQTLARAFLALDLNCSRCHDAPSGKSFKQEQLFGFAAMLQRGALKVPKTSSVPVGEGGRTPAVKVTLHAGTEVKPAFRFDSIVPAEVPGGLLRKSNDSREIVAARITSPTNVRFAEVLVNRIWKRYFSVGLIDPADDWLDAKPELPALLHWLAQELITHDYDRQHIERLILTSDAYRRSVVEKPTLFNGAVRRRMTAEQLVDSLFTAAGKGFGCEPLTFDPEGRQTPKQCTNFGDPKRAWQFVALANERDRPALALPAAQTFVDTLLAYGWNDNRTTSKTDRDHSPMPLQAVTLAHGLTHRRIARLSEDSAFTALAVEPITLDAFIEQCYERILTRKPTVKEIAIAKELLAEGFETRRTGQPPAVHSPRLPHVSWANHLNAAATDIKLKLEAHVRAGDPPTVQLAVDWRERAEDWIWSLVNAPEFVFLP